MSRICVVLGLCLALGGAAWADLQNVEVGGEIRIRGRWWENTYSNGIGGPRENRIPLIHLPKRPIGPFGTFSRYDFSEEGNDLQFLEQKTKLNVLADFTGDVKAFVELESFDRWGTDFRSDYVTGADFAPVTTNDVEVLQSYVELSNVLDQPLRVRIGRQQLKFGKGWLISDVISACLSLSFDGITATYRTEDVVVDAFLTKLAETGVAEEDGDTDFYGIYGTWLAPEVVNVSAYYYLLRDGRSLADTNYVWTLEWVEDALGLDDYDPTTLHTAGLRAYGQYSAFDYDLEAAYQWGEASQVGFGFKPFTYGDDDAEYDSWAADAELGYTFDVPWQPRVFVGGAYFGGEDNRDLSFIDWLNPFYTPEASVSFNRLFSGIAYSSILDIGQDLSNAWQARGGVQVKVRDNLSAGLTVAYWEALEPFDRPLALHLGRWYVPVAPEYSFLTRENDTDLGLTTHLHATYNYTDDLFIRVGWEHLFTGDGLEQGNFLHRFGQEFTGGRGGDDADYFYFDLGVKFPGGVAAMKPCGAL